MVEISPDQNPLIFKNVRELAKMFESSLVLPKAQGESSQSSPPNPPHQRIPDTDPFLLVEPNPFEEVTIVCRQSDHDTPTYQIQSDADLPVWSLGPITGKSPSKFSQVMHEFVQSDLRYLSHLEFVYRVYAIPSKASIPDLSDWKLVFNDIETLMKDHTVFIEAIHSGKTRSLRPSDIHWSEVPRAILALLKSSEWTYIHYISNQSKQFKKLLLYKDIFKRIHENSRSSKLDLPSYLLEPLQRIARIPLLLNLILDSFPNKEILEKTYEDADNPFHDLSEGQHNPFEEEDVALNRIEYTCLVSSNRKASDILARANDRTKEQENTEQLDLLSEILKPYRTDFPYQEKIKLFSVLRDLKKNGNVTKFKSLVDDYLVCYPSNWGQGIYPYLNLTLPGRFLYDRKIEAVTNVDLVPQSVLKTLRKGPSKLTRQLPCLDKRQISLKKGTLWVLSDLILISARHDKLSTQDLRSEPIELIAAPMITSHLQYDHELLFIKVKDMEGKKTKSTFSFLELCSATYAPHYLLFEQTQDCETTMNFISKQKILLSTAREKYFFEQCCQMQSKSLADSFSGMLELHFLNVRILSHSLRLAGFVSITTVLPMENQVMCSLPFEANQYMDIDEHFSFLIQGTEATKAYFVLSFYDPLLPIDIIGQCHFDIVSLLDYFEPNTWSESRQLFFKNTSGEQMATLNLRFKFSNV